MHTGATSNAIYDRSIMHDEEKRHAIYHCSHMHAGCEKTQCDIRMQSEDDNTSEYRELMDADRILILRKMKVAAMMNAGVHSTIITTLFFVKHVYYAEHWLVYLRSCVMASFALAGICNTALGTYARTSQYV